MAKKGKTSMLEYIIVAIVIGVILFALVTPLVTIIGAIYNGIKSFSIKRRLSGTMSDFWLTAEEKNAFKKKSHQLYEVTELIDQATEKGYKAGISINKDGSFSRRSRIGKEVQSVLEENEYRQSELIAELSLLKEAPLSRWAEFNSVERNGLSFMWSFVAWFMTYGFSGILLEKQSIAEIFALYSHLAANFIGTKKVAFTDMDIVAFIAATLAAIVVFFLARLIFKNTGQRCSPRPEEVTLYNVDLY